MVRDATLSALISTLLLLTACSGSSGVNSGGTPGTGGTAGAGASGGGEGGGGSGGVVANDSEPPSLTIDSEGTSAFRTYIVTGTVSDNVGVAEISVRANDGVPRISVATDGTYGAFADLQEGQNVVEVIARDAAGNEARESISVTYAPDPNAPTPPTVGAPSSIGLIEQELADGSIDEETALLYRVYAIYSDERLPAELRDDTGFIDATPILFEVTERFDSLQPATQALIAPFLIPPIYESSAFSTSSAAIEPKGPPDVCAANAGWISITKRNFRIWWNTLRPRHGAVASAMAAELGTSWRELERVMGRTPLKDDDPSIEFDGCSDHFDVYVDANYGGWAKVNPHKGQSNCDPWAGFMTINPSGTHLAELPWVAAHELMHAFQLAYRTCLTGSGLRWWTEASAAWAVDHVYPTAVDTQEPNKHFEHVYAEDFYLPTLDQSIDGLGGNKLRPYGAYLWPFYLAGAEGPSKIANIWGAIGKSTLRAQVLSAMDSTVQGGFHESFAKFMLQVWNQEPIDDFKQRELGMMPISPSSSTPKGVTEVSAHLDDQPDRNILMSLGLEPLAADFVHITFDDPKVHTVMFSNGFTFDLREGQLPDFPGPDATVYAKKLSNEERKGKRVWALVKQDGQWSNERYDLTDVAFVPFCQDVPDEAIEELVLINDNGRFEDTQPSTPKGLAPRLFVSNMGCGAWVGTAKVAIRVSDAPRRVETTTMNITNIVLTRPPGSLDDALKGRAQIDFLGTIIPQANFGGIAFGAGYRVDSLTADWSLSRTTQIGDNMCNAQGSGMFDENDFLGPPMFVVAPYLAGSITSQGSLYRSYQIQLSLGTMSNVVTGSCSQSGPIAEPFGAGLGGGFRESPLGSFLVSQDGQSIKKTWNPSPETEYTLELDATFSF